MYEGKSFFKSGNKCISFSPLKIKPHFIVGKCCECLKVMEKRNPNMDEPTRQVNPGENPVIMNPGTVSAVDIAILAVEWRWKVEEHESETPIYKDREERAHETRRKMRLMILDADWANYRSAHRGEVLPKILDLTEETRGNEALLENTVLELGQRCWARHFEGLENPALGVKVVNSKSFICTHTSGFVKRAGHGKCLAQALIRTRACLQCNRPSKFVLKSSFDDPKSRWDEEKKKWIQVEGYFDVNIGLNGLDFFELDGEEDRWGDETQKRARIYCLVQSASSHRPCYLNRIAVSGRGSR
jgi:hypothetical protein